MPKLIEKPVGMSREDALKLPPLIHRKVFIAASGLSEWTFDAMANDGDIKSLVVGRTGKRRMYYRDDLFRIIGYVKVEVKQNGN